MVMNIKIKELNNGIVIDLKWNSCFAYEHEIINIREWTIGRKEETISKELLALFKQKKSEGILRF